MWEKLDKALVNNYWLDNFPFSKVLVWPRASSDHTPISLHIDEHFAKKSKAKLKYEFFWEKFDKCRKLLD